MRSMLGLIAVASLLAGLDVSAIRGADQKQPTNQKDIAGQSESAQQAPGQSHDQWRYTFRNGEWWYWLPANRWVYWRNNCWNDYDPKTFVFPNSASMLATGQFGGGYEGGVANSDIRPFYGHAYSEPDRRPLVTNGEVGPFYGHALPTDVFGPWRSRPGTVRPFYGHAVSPDGD